MSDKLSDCPFCGSEPILTEHEPHEHSAALVALTGLPGQHPGSWTIECVACSCGMIHSTREEAISAWNRRASPAPAIPAVDEVDIIEQCAVCAAIHSQYPIENDFDRGYDKARKDAARSIRALKAAQAIPPCHCDMRTKALGDGCEVCQPENAPAPRSIRTPMPYIVPGSVRVCVVSDAECSRGCGDGPCKRI
ncbi:Lar family restriction alleviation protein [Burkholderia glumae]